MKVLYLVRHAKAGSRDGHISDEERPLSRRGKRDAAFMSDLLFNKGIMPSLIISSSARRAITTAQIFAENLKYELTEIRINPSIYEASLMTLKYIITSIDESVQSAMLFGHNPGFSLLASELCRGGINEMPTCAIAGIRFECERWSEITGVKGNLVLFEFPKKYMEDDFD